MNAPITPVKEIKRTDEIVLTTSDQNNIFHPCILCAFVPGKAANKSALLTRDNTAVRSDVAVPPIPLPIMTNGDSAVKIPRPARLPKTPKIPKISAIHGVIRTKTSVALFGSEGSLRNQSSILSIQPCIVFVFAIILTSFSNLKLNFPLLLGEGSGEVILFLVWKKYN